MYNDEVEEIEYNNEDVIEGLKTHASLKEMIIDQLSAMDYDDDKLGENCIKKLRKM